MERVFEAFYFITALILNIGNFLFIAVQRQRFRNIWRELLNDVRQSNQFEDLTAEMTHINLASFSQRFCTEKQSKDGELFEKYEARLDYLFTRFVLLLRSNMFVIMIPALLITMYHYWTNETMQETDWMIPLPLGWWTIFLDSNAHISRQLFHWKLSVCRTPWPIGSFICQRWPCAVYRWSRYALVDQPFRESTIVWASIFCRRYATYSNRFNDSMPKQSKN